MNIEKISTTKYIIIYMEKTLTSKERIILIRKGNELLNKGEIEKASKIFITTAYKDGLIRVGDYYYFEEKNPFKALHFYIEAKYEKRIRELTERMAGVLKKWLSEDH
ncbi:MAG: hypothetical protein AMS17_04445 [Spirochaetes bacterium DG_61]|nr:MAG: hypothetical protein AMS17_04445 [Spirochaetes bacterium DG_61]